MSTPTGDLKTVERLNETLGRELGRNEYGESVFQWAWSEELMWPAFPTGKKTSKDRVVEIPIIGGGTETITETSVMPEFKAGRQTEKRDTWFVTKWLSPWELITGPLNGHMRYGADGGTKPPDEFVENIWAQKYPGVDFPAKGWRVPVGGAWIPRGPGEPSTPNERDTREFIGRIREQTNRTFAESIAAWEAGKDWQDRQTQRDIEEIARDSFPAMLNPEPGKRGGFVSFPFSKWDR